MATIFSRAIAHLKSVIPSFQFRQFTALVLVGFLLLATNVNDASNANGTDRNHTMTNKVLERVHENNAPRPKTTGEWNQQDRETASDPDERGRRIGEQATSAFKEFGGGYVDATKNATKDAQKSAVRAGKELTN
ncbi:MAG: hypothetical protein NW224_20925 [Leptolyngbyaceae cyanobacterium bins.302]|nr:hypothetical protein [Leptolyngbyaceae cyanobacterium bins.302]